MPQLEALLRECTLTYGHIQLFRDDAGWQASIWHYGPKQQTDGKAFADPVEALSKALLEDARITRDLERRYRNAPKADAAIDEFEDLL